MGKMKNLDIELDKAWKEYKKEYLNRHGWIASIISDLNSRKHLFTAGYLAGKADNNK